LSRFLPAGRKRLIFCTTHGAIAGAGDESGTTPENRALRHYS